MLALSSSVFALCAAPVTSVAQEGAEEIEEIVVSGLRGRPRSAVDSAVPIDTFDLTAIEQVSHTDTQDILQTLIPSLNVDRAPISDGSTFIRNTQLRGLPAHHTLVLVNGKRRHRASLVQTGGSGRQGPDVATIPAAALQSIEVLRDGASSQYGSDAIAGVINFNLRNNSEGITLFADTGQFYEGDGMSTTIGGNIGLPLGENGFLSISGEYNDAEFSDRSEQYCESWFCHDTNNPRFGDSSLTDQGFATGTQTPIAQIQADGEAFNDSEATYLQSLQPGFPAGLPFTSLEGDTVQPWGQPNNESARIFYNAGIEMGTVELYSFGNYSTSEGDGGFFNRYPGNGTIETLRRPDGSYWNPLEFFAGGFTPRFNGEIEDVSGLVGLRGGSEAFSWDISARYGSNEIDYVLENTLNPSYGFTSPTSFRPGSLQNEETQFQIDLANEFDVGFETPLVFAYGLSYMDEAYDVVESSDVASYDDGPYALQDPFGFCERVIPGDRDSDFTGNPSTVAGQNADPRFAGGWGGIAPVAGTAVLDLDCGGADPAFTVVGVGANGFPGYSPAFSDDFERDSYAAYIDLSADVTERLFLQAAVRYEDYSDFGDETVGKIAGRYLINDNIAIRGSIGTGFRAPTPGQQGTTNVATLLPNGFPVATGLFPASGPVAQALGADPLSAETSTSYTLGFTAEIEGLSLTVDYYSIDIDDRFNAISTLDVSAIPPGQPGHDPDAYANFLALEGAGVTGAASIGGVRYFQNAFDTNTSGVDVVASYPLEWDNGQSTDLQFAYNYTLNKFESDPSDFLNEEGVFDFENFDPNTRWNLTGIHNVGEVTILGRLRFFGASDDSDRNGSFAPALFIQNYDATMFFDLEASWQINDNWRVTAGGRNLFDEYPDRVDRVASDNDYCCGRVYQSGSVVPWQGGYYYGRVNVSF